MGITKENPQEKIKAGQNDLVTFTVDNLVKTKSHLIKNRGKCKSEVSEVPGHVEMQTVIENDGNCFQICELLHHSCEHC